MLLFAPSILRSAWPFSWFFKLPNMRLEMEEVRMVQMYVPSSLIQGLRNIPMRTIQVVYDFPVTRRPACSQLSRAAAADTLGLGKIAWPD